MLDDKSLRREVSECIRFGNRLADLDQVGLASGAAAVFVAGLHQNPGAGAGAESACLPRPTQAITQLKESRGLDGTFNFCEKELLEAVEKGKARSTFCLLRPPPSPAWRLAVGQRGGLRSHDVAAPTECWKCPRRRLR